MSHTLYLFLRLVPCKICESGKLSTHAYGDPVKTNSAPTDPSTVLLILFFFLPQFFRKDATAITMQHWLILVHTKLRGDVRLVGVKLQYDICYPFDIISTLASFNAVF